MTRRLTGALVALVACAWLVAPATAGARAVATISSCRGDGITVEARLALHGRAARKARRATLEVRVMALPIFGFPRTEGWQEMGRRRRAHLEQDFSGLGADSWTGALRWRYRRGRRTVLSGVVRTSRARVGGDRGRPFCTIDEGLKPVDTTPPTLFLVGADDNWHRAPVTVQLLAQDDFSGVKSMRYSIDGGPITAIRNGDTVQLTTDGAHTIAWAATDVAGNTGTRTQVVRADAGPPSKPVLSRPFSVTASTSPTFAWSASSDGGSGLKGYFLAIKKASDGALVALQPYDPSSNTAASPAALADGETYRATVIAVDNTSEPWSSESDPVVFRVDTTPEATGAEPAAGAIITDANAGTSFKILLDRPAQPGSVLPSTVVLDRHSESGADPAYSVTCAGSPCTSVVVDPSGDLPEGRYALSLNGLKTEEGGNFGAFVARYARTFVEGDSASTPAGGGLCLTNPTQASKTYHLTTTDPAERGRFTFHWASNAAWTVTAKDSNGSSLGSLSGSAGASDGSFDLDLGNRPNDTLTLVLSISCSSTGDSLDLTNITLTRLP